MTQPEPPSTGNTSPLLGSASARIRVALASAVLLGAGALLAPPVSPTAVPASQEHAAPLLEEQMQPRVEAQSLQRVEEVPARVRQHSVVVLPISAAPSVLSDYSAIVTRPPPGAPGVVVADGFILTHAAALEGRSAVTVALSDGRSRPAEVVAFEPSTQLVLLKAPGPQMPPAPLLPTVPAPGTLIVGIAWSERSGAVVPMFISSTAGDRYQLAAADGAVIAGMPLYTTDGELVAVAGLDGEAFSAVTAVKELSARASAGERIASIGIAFQELTPGLSRVFGDGGALINAVVEGAPAERAGLSAGDVLIAVADAPVEAVDDALQSLRSLVPGTPARLTVRRAGRSRAVDVTPAFAYDVAALSRSGGGSRTSGPEARAVLPVSTLGDAGIPAGAQILAINGRPVASRAQAIRELARQRTAVPLLLRHGSYQFLAAVAPQR